MKKRTHEEFINEINEKHPDIKIIGEYINCETKLLAIHECGYKWYVRPSSLLRGHSCPKCNNTLMKTNSEFISELKQVNNSLTPLEEYKGNMKSIKIHCNICNGTFLAKPVNLLRNHGCPYCSHHKTLKGFNDIATNAPHLIDYLNNKNDAYLYTPHSKKEILFKCPECGNTKKDIIGRVNNQGYSCPYCGDNISYPNKFARSLLSQLPISNLKFEYQHPDLKNRFFDNYFEYNNNKYFLEMDGGFHFKESNFNGGSLEEVKKRDEEKDIFANDNNITMVRIDSKLSKLDYIKENILKSKLNDIFDLSNIDWELCDEFATKNFARYVCEFYEENKLKMKSKDILKTLNISEQTLSRYRKQGVKFGWCSYTDKEKKLITEFNNSKQVNVYDIDTKKHIGYFLSMKRCAEELTKKYNKKFHAGEISYALLHKDGIYNNLLFEYI